MTNFWDSDLFNFIIIPIGVLLIFLFIFRNKHVIAFKKRNRTLMNVLKVAALLYLTYHAVKSGKGDNYAFAIFYGFLAMYDTYVGDRERKKEQEEKKKNAE